MASLKVQLTFEKASLGQSPLGWKLGNTTLYNHNLKELKRDLRTLPPKPRKTNLGSIHLYHHPSSLPNVKMAFSHHEIVLYTWAWILWHHPGETCWIQHLSLSTYFLKCFVLEWAKEGFVITRSYLCWVITRLRKQIENKNLTCWNQHLSRIFNQCLLDLNNWLL